METVWSVTSGAFLKDRDIVEVVTGQLAKVAIKVEPAVTERSKLQADWLTRAG